MKPTMSFDDADPRLHVVYDYWRAKCGGRTMPARREIDPAELASVLPYLMVVDVEAGPRYRYRLFGTAVVDAFGMDPTGQYVDDVMTGDYKTFLLGLYDSVIARKEPVYSTSTYGEGHEGRMRTQRLMLPLASDGAHVDKVLACQVFLHSSPLKTLTVRLAQNHHERIENHVDTLE